MSAGAGASAFGVAHGPLAKSELERGRFAPAAALDPRQRQQVRNRVTRAAENRAHPPPPVPDGGRSMSAVYSAHAIASGGDPAPYFRAGSTPSRAHRRVEYGPSVSPSMRAAIDSKLRPGATARLRRPVVFHHGPLDPTTTAAAAPAHRTSGGKGHVVLGEGVFDHRAELSPAHRATGLRARDVLHHELAHAAIKGPNPANATARGRRAALGEEARADALGVRGPGLYARSGVLPGKHKARVYGWAARSKWAQKAEPATPLGIVRDQIAEGAEATGHYYRVHEKIRAAGHRGGPGDPGGASRAAGALRRRPQLLAVAGVAGGAALAGQARARRQRRGTSAFGVRHR